MSEEAPKSRFDQVPYPYKATAAKPKHFIRLPLCRQATNYTCGVSCLQSILAYWGYEYREDTLAEMLKTDPEHGAEYEAFRASFYLKEYHFSLTICVQCSQNAMVAFVKTLGFEATNEFGWTVEKLKTKIEEGIPVIVLYQAWTEEDVTTVQWEKQMCVGV